jgi:hypothetical protein
VIINPELNPSIKIIPKTINEVAAGDLINPIDNLSCNKVRNEGSMKNS